MFTRTGLPSEALSRIFAVGGLLFSLVAGRSAIYELFINIPGVNVPRVEVEQTQFAPHISFYLNTPTVAWFIVLLGSLVCGYSSVMLLWQPRHKKYRLSQVVGVIIVIIGFAVTLNNFFNSAGDF